MKTTILPKYFRIGLLKTTLYVNVALAATLSQAGEDRQFESRRLQLAERVGAALVEARACTSINDCRRRNMFYVSPATSGLAVEIRTVTESTAAQAVLREAARTYVEAGGRMRVSVGFYAQDKLIATKRGWLSKEKPVMSAIYKETE